MTHISGTVRQGGLREVLLREERVQFSHGPDHFGLMDAFFSRAWDGSKISVIADIGDPMMAPGCIIDLRSVIRFGSSDAGATIFAFTGSINLGSILPHVIQVTGMLDTSDGKGYIQESTLTLP